MTVNTRIWQNRKQSMQQTLDNYQKRSAVFKVLRVEDLDEELRAVVLFEAETLVMTPGGKVQRLGPVVAGIRYAERFLSEAPMPAEIVTLLEPLFIWHPNVAPNGALCLGHPPPMISLDQIVHMTWAALVFNMRVVNPIEWQGFNPRAAMYVKANPTMFPLNPHGLFEAKPPTAFKPFPDLKELLGEAHG
jgi:hypothetical protein